MKISGNVIGSTAGVLTKSYIFEDENGNEIIGFVVDNEIVFDAKASDIALNKIAGTEAGVTIGTHDCDAEPQPVIQPDEILISDGLNITPVNREEYNESILESYDSIPSVTGVKF